MTPERFRQIEELYHAARERTGWERAALLEQATPDLRREVESLLAMRADGKLLDRPAVRNATQLSGDSVLTGLTAGATLGPYRIESKLGEGGMGEVFRATDTRLGRAVAIKAAREQFSGRFEREAHAISSLNHPNICTVYDVGPNYLVMELVEGETIAARLTGGPLPVKTALSHAGQILAALAEAHAKGVIHRDLKPGNIMLAKSGIKVLDFGLAKSETDEALTISHTVMGTPAYMAPEQRTGEPADARSDIYSFGCVLYEMLTGVRCGPGRRRLPSRRLERLVSRCLEEDPARRWQSAAVLERELNSIATAVGHVKRNTAAIALAAVFVIVFGVGGSLLFARKTPVLTNKDTIVLANFTNTTGDPVFDGTLRQGLSVQLEQSPFLSIVPDAQIQQTLELMGRKPDTRLTPDIARELCQRVGSAAVMEGSIAQIGTPYLLTLKAVDCASGESLASAEAQAADKSHVLDALGRTAAAMREKLGESLSTVRKFNTPLEQATTPSLEALKAYSAGLEITGPAAAIPFFTKATELDPDFASAYAWLGIEYTALGESAIAAGYTRKAYELKDRASEPEKYFISAVYYKEVTGDIPRAVQTCTLWTQAYPRAAMPHNYLAGAIYPIIGEYENGVEESREAIRLNPEDSAPYAFGMFNATALDRPGVAKSFYRQAVGRKVHGSFYPLALYQIAFLEHDTQGMSRQVAVSKQLAMEDELLSLEAATAAYSGRLGEAREFSRQAVESAERGKESEAVATYLAMSALREALFGNRPGALASLRLSAPYEFGQTRYSAVYWTAMYPAYVRGEAYLAAHQGAQAAAEFQKILDHRGIVVNEPIGALAHLQLARAWALEAKSLHGADADTAYARTRAAYREFLSLWKDADPDIPILKQANTEYANLKVNSD